MPYTISSSAMDKGKFQVKSPNGIKSKCTTKKKAQKQVNLLQGIEHGWTPTKGKPSS